MSGMCGLSAEFGGEDYIRRVGDTAVVRTGLYKQVLWQAAEIGVPWMTLCCTRTVH